MVLDFLKTLIISIEPFYNIAILIATAFLLVFFAASERKGLRVFIIAIALMGIGSSLVLDIIALSKGISSANLLFSIEAKGYLQIALILFISIFVLLFLGIHNLERQGLSRIVLIFIGLLISISFFVISRDFIAIFVSFTSSVLFLFFLISSINKNKISNPNHLLRFFLRPALATVIVFGGFSFIYGSTDFNNFQQILESDKAGSPFINIGVTMFIVAVFLALFTPPIHNPYSKLIKRSSPGTESLIFFIYFFIILSFLHKISDFYIPLVQQSDILLYLSLSASGLFILAGNIVALSTKSLRRIVAFTFFSFMGIPVLDIFLKSRGFFTDIDLGLVYLNLFLFLFLSYMPIIAVNTYLEKRNGEDSMANLKGLYFKDPYLCIGLVILLLNLAGLIGFQGFIYRYHYARMFFSDSGWLFRDLPMTIALIFISLSVILILANAIRLIIVLFKRGGEVEDMQNRSPRYRFLYIIVTLFILIDMYVGITELIAIFGGDTTFTPVRFLDLFIS